MARDRSPAGRLAFLCMALVVASPLTAPAVRAGLFLDPTALAFAPPPAVPSADAPVASFDFQPQVPIPDAQVFFDAGSSTDPDGNITSYSWDFGDGANYTSPDGWAGHTFGSVGTFPVSLTVRDDTGLTGSAVRNVTVTPGPVASFTISSEPVYIGQTVTFDASASSDSMRTIISYQWSFGDTRNANGVIVTHVYTTTGDMGVRLLIIDDGGFWAEAFRFLMVGYDVGPPVSSVALAGVRGENGWFRSPVIATLRATDEGSGVATLEYRVDDGPWQAYSAPLTFSDGERVLEYFATDRARRVEAFHASPIRVDSTPPEVVRLDPSGIVPSTNVTVAWSATDHGSGIARFEVSLDGGPFASVGTNDSLTIDLPGGSHSVLLRAVDGAGNVAERSTTFRVGPERRDFPAGPLLFGIVASVSVGSVAFALYRTKGPKARSPEETPSEVPKNAAP